MINTLWISVLLKSSFNPNLAQILTECRESECMFPSTTVVVAGAIKLLWNKRAQWDYVIKRAAVKQTNRCGKHDGNMAYMLVLCVSLRKVTISSSLRTDLMCGLPLTFVSSVHVKFTCFMYVKIEACSAFINAPTFPIQPSQVKKLVIFPFLLLCTAQEL